MSLLAVCRDKEQYEQHIERQTEGRCTCKSEETDLVFVGLQGVVVTDEEKAHGGHQELKQLY